MRLRNLLFPFLAFLLGGTLYADDWQPDPQFRSLFNGKDLTGWCFRAKADGSRPGSARSWRSSTTKHSPATPAVTPPRTGFSP